MDWRGGEGGGEGRGGEGTDNDDFLLLSPFLALVYSPSSPFGAGGRWRRLCFTVPSPSTQVMLPVHHCLELLLVLTRVEGVGDQRGWLPLVHGRGDLHRAVHVVVLVQLKGRGKLLEWSGEDPAISPCPSL